MVKSLSLWESRPERPERVFITLVVFNLPLALTGNFADVDLTNWAITLDFDYNRGCWSHPAI